MVLWLRMCSKNGRIYHFLWRLCMRNINCKWKAAKYIYWQNILRQMWNYHIIVVVFSCIFRRGVLDTTLCDKVCQWRAAGWWFSPGTLVFSTNKIDCHSWNIVESGIKHHNPNPNPYIFCAIESYHKNLPLKHKTLHVLDNFITLCLHGGNFRLNCVLLKYPKISFTRKVLNIFIQPVNSKISLTMYGIQYYRILFVNFFKFW